MNFLYHPEFPEDVRRIAQKYRRVSERLERRFRAEVDVALARIKSAPASAGHFLNTSSLIVRDVRRRNLQSFPYFILYGSAGDLLVVASLIPSAADPLTWLDRLSPP